MAFEIKGKVTVKAGNKKGFKIEGDNDWFTANTNVIDSLAKVNVGDLITIEYEKKGVFRNVTKLSKAIEEKKEEPKGTIKKCKCGADIKNPAYDICYTCSQKGKTDAIDGDTKNNKLHRDRIEYGSPEDINGKEVGCAAGAAASILAGRQEQADVLLEMFNILFTGILERIRAEK
jgi:hypothetical protein